MQSLDILGIISGNMHAKYAVALFEDKVLTWWRGMAGTYTLDMLSWSDLCALLEAEFQDIDREMKLRCRIQGLRHAESV